MIISRTPLRVSFFGGSTDNPAFIKKFKKSSVINFSTNLYTYSSIFSDKFGYNSQMNKYILNYSKQEVVNKINEIKNDIMRECFRFHNIPPISVYFTSDIFSKGSGLAASSAYTLSLLKCIYKLKKITISKNDLIKQALFIERKFNKFCGYQDPFGCGIPGFKIINTKDDVNYKIKKLDNNIFKKFNFYLLPTFLNRNSQNILKNLSKSLHSIYPIYEVAKEAENLILNKDYVKFLKLMKVSWDLKKSSHPQIMKNNQLLKIDNILEKDKNIISHKLLGAGLGGFFLLVSNKKNFLNYYKPCIKINFNE